MRANLTFSLKDTSTDDLVRAVGAAIGGDLSVAKAVGAKVKVLRDRPTPFEDEDDES